MEERKVIVHFHNFKNAGCTVDYILRNNFRQGYQNYDPNERGTVILPKDGRRYINNQPALMALSSHQLLFPLPDDKKLKIYSILFLRHPIDRIGSIYRYERISGQSSDDVLMAKETDIKSYISSRLNNLSNIRKVGVIANFQVRRLSYQEDVDDFYRKITKEKLIIAKKRLSESKYFGIVDLFNESILYMKSFLEKDFPGLDYTYTIQNRTTETVELGQRLNELKQQLGDQLYTRLYEINQYDMELYDYGVNLFNDRMNMVRRNIAK